jgi:hypothetical protein
MSGKSVTGRPRRAKRRRLSPLPQPLLYLPQSKKRPSPWLPLSLRLFRLRLRLQTPPPPIQRLQAPHLLRRNQLLTSPHPLLLVHLLLRRQQPLHVAQRRLPCGILASARPGWTAPVFHARRMVRGAMRHATWTHNVLVMRRALPGLMAGGILPAPIPLRRVLPPQDGKALTGKVSTGMVAGEISHPALAMPRAAHVLKGVFAPSRLIAPVLRVAVQVAPCGLVLHRAPVQPPCRVPARRVAARPFHSRRMQMRWPSARNGRWAMYRPARCGMMMKRAAPVLCARQA